ncbi:ParM/StbA family protein [Luteimonas sp. MHLX1A]|uniref:ParM/StbA family protein n=1 Tax=Alterluteimonas muca TaxID=2878684 RepID=UPI001E5D40DC|nr:ParM/StbA family protein [Luteimonas sp. MHLX1A]MCD9046847.1 ParM/StbA family protein [Luteimonas sp. MHLX1A]
MLFMGLDLGYSSAKLAFGSGRDPEIVQLPIGAAPLDRCGLSIDGSVTRGGGHEVMINGEQWLAGIDPSRISNFVQSMDESYSSTDEYRALFYAALAEVGKTHIDVLVTGLPVSHYRNQAHKDQLLRFMEGRHHVRPDLIVTVAKAIVIPQPAGAFTANLVEMAKGRTKHTITGNSSVLVVDPGHYSLDWCMFLHSIRIDSSFSTSQAGERVVHVAAERLSEKHGIKVRPARLQEAVLTSAGPLQIGSHEIDFWPALHEAAKEIVEFNLRKIRANIRSVMDERGIDLILVAGGGAELFAKPLAEAFPEAEVVKLSQSITANARGFYAYATQQAQAPKVA